MSHALSRRAVVHAGLTAAAAAVVGPSLFSGRAEAATSSIIPCDTWGARAASSPITVLTTNPNKIIIHHTDTANTTDYSQAHAMALARSIQTYHMDTNGWIDTGQHFTITRGGYVLEGRHRSLEVLQAGQGQVVSAHCTGQNNEAIGIENEGVYTSVAPPAALYNQLVTLCADICRQYQLSPNVIYGHRDFNSTDCPGDVLYAQLPALRSAVAAQLGTVISAWPTVASGASGERVRTVQYLLRQDGQTLTADGAFGPATLAGVQTFQQAHGLTVDGSVGPGTWPVLIVTVRQGLSGEAVKAVQSQLNTRGATLTVDGAFGALTDAAVRSYQSSNGLTADGMVGPNTWQRLVS